jgi:hypothetical protein
VEAGGSYHLYICHRAPTTNPFQGRVGDSLQCGKQGGRGGGRREGVALQNGLICRGTNHETPSRRVGDSLRRCGKQGEQEVGQGGSSLPQKKMAPHPAGLAPRKTLQWLLYRNVSKRQE